MDINQNPIIRYENVGKAYGEKAIISGFSLDIPERAFLTIIGSSGSGKTTLLKMINGLILPDSGAVYVRGRDVRKEDLIALRRNIGYVIQSIGLFPHMTVAQNIAYVPSLVNRLDKEKTREAVHKWIDVVGLEHDMLSRYPDELSGGQQQRVGIARALAASPGILLMDEPFGAVDGLTRHQLQDEMKRIHREQDVTVVFVTHDLREALKLGTLTLVMDHGQALQYDTPDRIRQAPATPFVERLLSMA